MVNNGGDVDYRINLMLSSEKNKNLYWCTWCGSPPEKDWPTEQC